ncbi:MAG: hypothetical protein V8S87_05250 [Oscillospiraceae bacterium]
MKKIIALVLCLVMVFALCACGESNTATTAPAADTATEAPAEEPPQQPVPSTTSTLSPNPMKPGRLSQRPTPSRPAFP